MVDTRDALESSFRNAAISGRPGSATTSPEERIARSFVPEPNSGCWLWTGTVGNNGYGRIQVGSRRDGTGKSAPAHVISYLIHRGPVPEGHFVCHRCDTPTCVNPDHLFVGTAKDNNDDARRKGRSKAAARGELHPNAVLTTAEVSEVKRMIRAGMTPTPIGSALGISRNTVKTIRRGGSWAWLTEAK